MSKRSKKSSNLFSIFIIIVLVAIFIAFVGGGKETNHTAKKVVVEKAHIINGQKSETIKEDSLGSERVDFTYVVPPMVNLSLDLSPLPARELSDEEFISLVKKALTLIRSVRGYESLQTPQDEKINGLLDELEANKWQLQFVRVPAELQDKIVLGYGCQADNFAYSNYEISVPVLAMTLYHELTHVTQCRELMSRYGVKSHLEMEKISSRINRCDVEAPASASEIRMFIALVQNNKLERYIYLTPDGGGDLIGSMHQDWISLLQSKVAFCRGLGLVYKDLGEELLLKKWEVGK